jgi:hypothetical protein
MTSEMTSTVRLGNSEQLHQYHVRLSTLVICVVIGMALAAYWSLPVLAEILCTLAAGLCCWRLRWRLPVHAVRNVISLGIVLILGIANSFSHDAYDALKDAWYFATPIIGVIAGDLAVSLSGDVIPVVVGIVIAGSVSAVVFIIGLAANASVFFAESDIADVRAESGAGPTLSLLAVVGLYVWYSQLRQRYRSMPTIAVALLVAVNLAALAFSFSRILWLGTGIALVVTMSGRRSWRGLVRAVSSGAVIACLAFIVVAVMPADLRQTVSDKVVNSLAEIVPSDYTDFSDINKNWRGFEALMGLRTYLDGTTGQLAVGHGFGQMVDLGIAIQLGDAYFDRIPILHNGYVYLLVKVGWLGALLYLSWIIGIVIDGLRSSRRCDPTSIAAGQYSMFLGVYLLASTMVVSGIFNKLDGLALALLIGAMQACDSGRRQAKGMPFPGQACRSN